MKVKQILAALALSLLVGSSAWASCDVGHVRQFSANGNAAAAVSVTLPPYFAAGPKLDNFTAFCGFASGSTSEGSITISGLAGTGTPTFPLDESTTATYQLTYRFDGVPSLDPSTSIVISVPAVTSGGKCSIVATYCY